MPHAHALASMPARVVHHATIEVAARQDADALATALGRELHAAGMRDYTVGAAVGVRDAIDVELVCEGIDAMAATHVAMFTITQAWRAVASQPPCGWLGVTWPVLVVHDPLDAVACDDVFARAA
jgi:hypothetical protein